ncbi:acyltransferase family protein [Priestia endophytica]|uniref:Acetyltransferase n=1 Tax=Priestia endophytica TaxID=135735 RepID=A0AAX1Q6F4_9BACI|nr:acyltransferase family protein [Priestia endophytica]RAS74840.1 acetyltransferase [Priestia endophytica]RAS87895.1 acetyltransferase [Priestia endophytica]
MSNKTHHRYVYGLDGLRAFAVLSVIAYHLNFSWAKGGFLGVDVFFVLSGYLITSIILPSHGSRLTFDFRDFWIRRIRRLLPAAYVMIIATVVWVVLFKEELLATVRGDAVSSLFYTSNWWFIFHKLSYFDSFGSPSPLKNLWSLAIEEQFYLLWPILLAVGFYIFKRRSVVSCVVLVGILISAMSMGMLYEPGMDPSRVYYGTDTRSFELLVGCWLALVWPLKRLSAKELPVKVRKIFNGVSIVSFLIIILCFFFVSEYQTFVYQGGMLLFCLNTAILVACICHPSNLLGKLLSWKPLRWIGSRSYGIYLWHYPVIVLTTPVEEIGTQNYWRIALQIFVTFVVAEWSYRMIEMPIRKNGFRQFFKRYIPTTTLTWKKLSITRKLSTVAIFLIVLVFTAGVTGLAKGEVRHESPEKTSVKVSPNQNEEEHAVKEKEEESQQSKDTDSKEKESESSKADEQEKSSTPPEKIFAIGDSVMLDIAGNLHEKYPNITIDGKVGRQLYEAIEIAPSYASFNNKDAVVVIELGTNGYFTDEQIDKLLSYFDEANVYLVNTRVPRSWEDQVNETLAKKAKEYKNVKLINWHKESLEHPEYFGGDGVHLTQKGSEALTELIQDAVNE